MPLDARAKRFLDLVAVGARAQSMLSVAERRRGFATLMSQAGTPRPPIPVRNVTVDGGAGPLAARLYEPAAGAPAGPGLVFFHGGGFVSGDLDTHDGICGALAEASRCRVLAVDYRLAPEHRFPAAHADAWAATCAIARDAADLGIDAARLAVGGDSVGAGLAAAVAQRAARDGGPSLEAQLLICPVLALDGAGGSRAAFASGYFLDLAMIAADAALCGLGPTQAADPLVSPLHASDFAGTAPALIHTAEFDPVRDDGEIYAQRLTASGVPARLVRHAGMIHLFYGFGRLIPYGAAALDAIGAELGAALRAGPPKAEGAPR